MRRPGKEAAARALQAQAAAIRAQERPTPSGEPHRISEPLPTLAETITEAYMRGYRAGVGGLTADPAEAIHDLAEPPRTVKRIVGRRIVEEPWPADDRTLAERASGPSSDEANRAAAESE